jgi:hypothetical protein
VSVAVGDWLADPHGRGEKLRGKRLKRNPLDAWQGIFPKDFDGAAMSGLVTSGEGSTETLADDAARPWGQDHGR